MNISPSNIFLTLLLPKKISPNCQTAFAHLWALSLFLSYPIYLLILKDDYYA